MRIQKFDDFILEKFGISSNVVTQGKEFFDLVNADKSKFVFIVDYFIDGKKHPLRIKIDSQFKMGGQFQPQQKPPTIVIRDRSSLSTLTHELKHADRFFRIGMSAYTQDYSLLFDASGYKKSLALLPSKFRNMFFIFYFLQKEEFEAQFHSDFLHFKDEVEKLDLSDDLKQRKLEVMALWREKSKNYMAWKIYSGTLPVGKVIAGTSGNIEMNVPEQQKPFKFENWCDARVIDSIVWTFMKNKKGIEVEDTMIFKFLKAFVPDQIMSMFNQGVPKNYRAEVDRYKQRLEKKINATMDLYRKKYLKIPYSFIQR